MKLVKTRSLVAIMVAILMTLSLVIPTSAVASMKGIGYTPNVEQVPNSAVRLIQAYYEMQMVALKELQPIRFSEQQYVDVSSVAGHNLVARTNEVIIASLAEIKVNGVTERYNIKNLDVRLVNIRPDVRGELVVTVEVTILNKVNMEVLAPFIFEGENTFVISQDKKIKSWKTVKGAEDWLFKGAYLSPERLQTTTLDEATQMIEAAKHEIIPEPMRNEAPFGIIRKSYSSTNAVEYANRWASDRNSIFPAIPGNDCVNFASQCMSYGFGNNGRYADRNSYLMASWWHCYSNVAGSNDTDSWRYLPKFYEAFEQTHSLGPQVDRLSISQVSAGDVLHFATAGPSWDHAGFCVQASPLKWAQHTTDGYGTSNLLITKWNGGTRVYRPRVFFVQDGSSQGGGS